MKRIAIACLIAARAGAAWAQPPAPATPVFEPPRAHNADVPYPADAPPHSEPVAVTVKLTVDATGAVIKVERVSAPQPGFDEAVIAAARGFRFDPATYGGKPVAAEVAFTQTFLPPAPPEVADAAPEDGPRRSASLRGKLVELGTRAPVSGATVTASAGERSYVVDADARGQFVLPLPDGRARITVTAPGHRAFLQQEQLVSGQELAVTYLVERDRYDPYEIVVTGELRREEVSRIALRGAEIKQVPGTFGDPFRVVQALPGVSAIASLLAFPIVRGNGPSATGISIDGTRIPLLYHLGAGPSVIHPEFVDEIDFYPGGAPVAFGGYIGGILDGRTRRAGRDERVVDVDVNLVQAGGLVREPIRPLGATLTIAGRYGYPGLVLGQVSNELSLSYWDYQLRLDGGTPNNGWTVFAFGARDELDELRDVGPELPFDPSNPFMMRPRALRPALVMSFHRLDLRGHRTFGDLRASARAVLGRDRSLVDDTGDAPARFAAWVAEPSARLDWRPAAAFTGSLGIEGALHDTSARFPASGDMLPDVVDGAAVHGLGRSYRASGFAEAVWRPSDDWLVRPGVRADRYSDRSAAHSAVDPRLTVRYRLARRDLDDVPPDSDDSSIWLKASAGIYHQPPRYLVPIPGLDQLSLSYGLLRSVQTSLGVEVPLPARFEVTAEGYYNELDPTFFELARPRDPMVALVSPVLFPGSPSFGSPDDPYLDQFAVRASGRSFGAELMARRRSTTGIYGWASYTLSLSERLRDGRWRPYDFDRTHLVNVVAGIPLGRSWDFGVRLQYQSGKPEPVLGEAVVRNAGYARFDVRFDKHAAWRSWILDFYVDITNVAVMPEQIEAGETIRYALPTAGVRGRF
jgi:TonB family protein